MTIHSIVTSQQPLSLKKNESHYYLKGGSILHYRVNEQQFGNVGGMTIFLGGNVPLECQEWWGKN